MDDNSVALSSRVTSVGGVGGVVVAGVDTSGVVMMEGVWFDGNVCVFDVIVRVGVRWNTCSFFFDIAFFNKVTYRVVVRVPKETHI